MTMENEQVVPAPLGPVERGVRPGAEAPTPPEPAGFRTRYRSEPGMIGRYPWTYADAGRRKGSRPECEYEDLFTAEQMRTAVEAARMAGVRSVQEQTAVIVRAALELLESIEGETPFTAEAVRAFKRVFGA